MEGRLFVCAKSKMTSVKVNEIKDGERELTEVKSLPKGEKAV
jgi:hypothetical protein